VYSKGTLLCKNDNQNDQEVSRLTKKDKSLFYLFWVA